MCASVWVAVYMYVCLFSLAGLSNPIDTVFHLQPVMILTLLPLAVFVDGEETLLSSSLLLPLPSSLSSPLPSSIPLPLLPLCCTHMINQTSRRLNKAKQIKSTRLRKSFFWLPQVGFAPTTLCSLDRVLCSVDMGRITNTKQGKANHLNLINRYTIENTHYEMNPT